MERCVKIVSQYINKKQKSHFGKTSLKSHSAVQSLLNNHQLNK